MTVLRNVWTDLVEKKLWPVAVLLLVAIAAIPVVVGGGGDDASQTASTPVAPSPGASLRGATAADLPAAQVSLDTDAVTAEQHRKGSTRDPFLGLHGAGQAATTTTTTPTPAAGATPSVAITGGAGAGAGGTATPDTGSTGTTPSTTTPGTTTPPAPVNPLHLYRVSIRFGKAGELKTRKDIARLTPLPSSQFPFFVYLGVLSDKKTAVFLISSDVKATGDGTCRPSKTNCQTIELRGGDTEFFDYSPSGGEEDVTQFQMDLLSVHKKTASSTALAAVAKKRTDKKGTSAYLAAKAAKLVPAAAGYRYSRADGLLHRVVTKKARRAAASRVPKAVVKKTRWGTIVKANGAVAFAAKKARKAAHS